MARLQKTYNEEIRPALMTRFGYSSIMQVPRITKITLNMGVGEAVADKKILQAAIEDLAKISGKSRSPRSRASPSPGSKSATECPSVAKLLCVASACTSFWIA